MKTSSVNFPISKHLMSINLTQWTSFTGNIETQFSTLEISIHFNRCEFQSSNNSYSTRCARRTNRSIEASKLFLFGV